MAILKQFFFTPQDNELVRLRHQLRGDLAESCDYLARGLEQSWRDHSLTSDQIHAQTQEFMDEFRAVSNITKLS
jgi:hypothetical protein